MIRLLTLPVLVITAAILFLLIVTSSADSQASLGSPAPAKANGLNVGLGRAHVRATICEVFGPRCGPALRVAICESALNPQARGRAGELSIFQIHPIWFWRTVRSSAGRIYVNPRRLHDPLFASRVAFVMSWGGTYWRPWSACL